MRDATFDLAESREWVQHFADVLCRRDLYHFDEAEIRVDVHHCTMGNKGERHVAVTLTVFIEFFGRAMVMLECLVERQTACGIGDRHSKRAHRVDDLCALDGESDRVEAVLLCHRFEHSLAHKSAGAVDCTAAHPCLPRRRSAACAADGSGDGLEQHRVDTEHAARNLLCEHDETLADFGGGELQCCDAVGKVATRGGVVVEAFGVHQVLDGDTPADTSTDVRLAGREARATRDLQRVRGVRQRCGHRQRRCLTDATFHRRDTFDYLTGNQLVAGAHGVLQTDVDR